MTRCTCSPKRSRRAGGDQTYVLFPSDGALRDDAVAWFRDHTQPTLDAAFAPGELVFPLVVFYCIADDLTVNAPKIRTDGWVAGYHKYVANDPKSSAYGLPPSYEFVEIATGALGNDYAVIHEVVHALRHHQGRTDPAYMKEEVLTDLEALARAPWSSVRRFGALWQEMHRMPNFHDLLGEKAYDAWRADRVLLTGGLQKHIGNASAVARVREVYAQTHLSNVDGRASFRRNRPLWMAI